MAQLAVVAMTLDKYVDELGRRLDVSASVIDDYEARIADLTERVGSLAADLLEEQAQRRELGEALVRVTEERDTLRVTAESVTRSLKRAIDERDEARAERNALLEDVANGAVLADQLHRERDEARAEVVRLGRENDRLQEQLSNARLDVGEMTGDLAAFESRSRADAAELVRLRTIIGELGAAEAAEPQEAFRPEESQSGLCEVGKDKVTCIVTDQTHRLMYHSDRPVPPYAKCPNAQYPEHGSRSPCAICGWSRP